VDLQAWNLEKLLSVGYDDKKGLKKGAGPLVFVMLHRASPLGRRGRWRI
jgi:hypothetical protein